MPIERGELDAIVAAIRGKVGDGAPCPMCRATDGFDVLEEYAQADVSPSLKMEADHYANRVQLACRNCGFIALFAPATLGLPW